MVGLWSWRPSWLGKLGLMLLTAWLIVLIVSVSQVYKTSSSASFSDSVNRENAQRLVQMASDFEILKKQNEALRNIIVGDEAKPIKGDHLGTILDQLEKASVYRDAAEGHGEPSFEHEELRRRVRNNIQEMWYYINAELNRFKKHPNELTFEQRESELQDAIKNVWEHKKSLLIDVDRLTKADGHDEWREKEAKELSDLVQRRFTYLQNPKDCNKAKKLLCNLNKGCGFGCQIHHVVYCFLVAFGTERTMILKSKGWRYHKEGWDSIFKPLSDTCLSTSGDSYINWPGDANVQVINLPIVDNVHPKPKYQPPGIPADIAPRLEKLHGHPLVWWVGQVLKFLMRPQDDISKVLEEAKNKLGFKKPIVGIHVRRTDKIGSEADFHDIDEYMMKVKQYFDGLEEQPDVRRVFIASDDPKVIPAARNRYPNYEIIGDPAIAETASVSRRYSDVSLHGIMIDIHLLSLSDFLVCTFSSQVCRVAYELMQTFYIDAYNRFASLDDVYYYGGQNSHPSIAILEHKPRKSDEIELKVGDLVEVLGNHWNGFSKARNLRTNSKGLYPSFKVVNRVKKVDFPKYSNVPLHEIKV